MDNTEIKNRLKTLERLDPLVITVNEKVVRSFQKDNKIKFFISDNIKIILKDLYGPLGHWKQHPTADKEHFGVVINNYWMEVNQFDTNWSTHIILFNRVNKFIVSYFRKYNNPLVINDYSFTTNDQFKFEENYYLNYDKTLNQIKRFFVILNHYKEKIFLPGNEIYDVMVDVCRRTMSWGQKAQDFYLLHINEIFDDITHIKSVKERGEYEDMKMGVDIWTTHKNGKIVTHQVKGTCGVISVDNGYIINTAIPSTSKCNFFVFVCSNSNRIIIFKIDYNKIKMNKGEENVFFSSDLLYFDKFY